jgi:hypothetical protein
MKPRRHSVPLGAQSVDERNAPLDYLIGFRNRLTSNTQQYLAKPREDWLNDLERFFVAIATTRATPRKAAQSSALRFRAFIPRGKSPRSESAVVAHFTACIAATAIANIISAIQSRPRQSLRGEALESSEGFVAGATKPTMRDSSVCV